MIYRLSGPGSFRISLASAVFLHHVSNVALGRSAVYLFFALSGFWIEKIWNQRYSRTTNPYLTFMISRFWRLLPVFWLVGLLVVCVRLFLLGTICDGIPHIETTLSSIFILGYNTLSCQPMDPAWSLDIELQFYLIAPLLIALFKGRRRPLLLLSLSGLLSACSALYFGKFSVFSYTAFFCVGIVYSQLHIKLPRSVQASSLGSTCFCVIVVALSPLRSILFGGQSPGPLFVYNEALNVLIAVLAAPYALSTTNMRGSRHDPMLGELSYIIYLLHWAAALYAGQIGGSPLHRLPFLVVAVAMVYATSYLIWRFYDRPIDAIRKAWVRQRYAESEDVRRQHRVRQSLDSSET